MTYDERGAATRRTVLGGLAAGAGALGADILLPAEVEAATLHGALPRRVDCVVVGAGIAGLVAARSVARQGRSVLVVEARNRVGGRVLNHRLPNGSVIESGGAFVGPTQDHLLALAKSLGVGTFKEYQTGDNVYVSPTTGRTTYPTAPVTGNVPPDPLILPDAANLQQQMDSMAAEIDVNAPWAHPKAKEQ